MHIGLVILSVLITMALHAVAKNRAAQKQQDKQDIANRYARLLGEVDETFLLVATNCPDNERARSDVITAARFLSVPQSLRGTSNIQSHFAAAHNWLERARGRVSSSIRTKSA